MGNRMTVVASSVLKSVKITKWKKNKNKKKRGECKRIKTILYSIIKRMRKHKLKNNLCSLEVVGHQAYTPN